jgi:hypothetical protein
MWEPLSASQPANGVTPVSPLLDRFLFSALKLEAEWIGRA